MAERLVVSVESDLKGIRSGITELNTKLGSIAETSGRTSGALGKLSGAFGTLQTAAGVALGGLALKGLDMLGQGLSAVTVGAIKAGSDMSEAMNKVSVVFGDSGAAMNEFAKTTAQSMGLSRSEALGALGTFGNMFTQLGIGSERAGELSTGMVTLASDFASFHNADISDVIIAQTAAFRGEYDALQRFVPTINAAAVEQRALEMTGKATTKALTDQEKALAVHALMMEGAGSAVGDFARTSDGMANAQRIITASFADMQAVIGEKLLPIIAPLVSSFAKALPGAIAAVSSVMDGIIGGFDALGRVLGPIKDTIAALVSGQGFDALYDRLNDLLGVDVAGFFISIIDPIARLLSGSHELGSSVGRLQDVFQILESVAGEVWQTFREFADNFRDRFLTIFGIAMRVVGEFVAFWEPKFAEAIAAVEEFIQGLDPNLSKAIANVLLFIQGAIDIFTGFWEEHWDTIRGVLHGAWTIMEGVIKVAWALISGIITVGLAVLAGDWDGAWQGIKDTLAGVWDGIKTIIEGGLKIFANLALHVLDAALQIGDNIVEGIKKGIERSWNLIIDVLDKRLGGLISFTRNILEERSPSEVFAEIGEGISEGLAEGIEAGAGAAEQAMEAVTETVRSAFAGQVISVLEATQAYDEWRDSIKQLVAEGNIEAAADQFAAMNKTVKEATTEIAAIQKEIDKLPPSSVEATLGIVASASAWEQLRDAVRGIVAQGNLAEAAAQLLAAGHTAEEAAKEIIGFQSELAKLPPSTVDASLAILGAEDALVRTQAAARSLVASGDLAGAAGLFLEMGQTSQQAAGEVRRAIDEVNRAREEGMRKAEEEARKAAEEIAKIQKVEADWWNNSRQIISDRASAEAIYNQQLQVQLAAIEKARQASTEAAAAQVSHWRLVSAAIGEAITSTAELNIQLGIAANQERAGQARNAASARENQQRQSIATGAAEFILELEGQGLNRLNTIIGPEFQATLEEIAREQGTAAGAIIEWLRSNGWQFTERMLDAPVPHLAMGGRVMGGGLAMLHAQETVMPATVAPLDAGAGIDYNRLAQALARELENVHLSVDVDDVHAGLIRKGRRNGGVRLG